MSTHRPLESHEKINITSHSMWEPLRGYSRAVQVGPHLYISGTTAIDRHGDVVGTGDPYVQTRFVIERVKEVLSSAGFRLSDVVRTRLFVTQMGRWDEYAKAHREAFEAIRPASSIVQVSKLVDPRLMIEMEVDAIAGCTLI
ncbi:MAG: hypothetical protein RL417_1664, partial [Pseudomonadota bacterium]